MSENKYLALLRGINVGGNNIIKMTDLKSCFEKLGFNNVLTYIQSGNVVFTSDIKDKNKLTKKIEHALTERFNYKALVVVITHRELKKVIDEAPHGFGKDADAFRYDVLFVKEPSRPDDTMKVISTREGVDRAYAGKSVLYFSRLISKASQSRLTKIVALPVYKNITIRNWNTTTKLLALMEN
jgi:uncharacterized protein (DUF1697 family)